jgi:proteasome lid subunit RPN8/RPN11
VIAIPAQIRDEMVLHALEQLPYEACGLLAGTDGSVSRFYPTRNADRSRFTFRLDPKEQLRVFTDIENEGLDLVGIFHSHTHTEAYPSPTDRAQAFYPEAHYVLVSLQDRDDPRMRAFTIREGLIEEQEVRFE